MRRNKLRCISASLLISVLAGLGCNAAELPVIEGNDIFHILIPDIDSFQLQVSNQPIQDWYVEKQGNSGEVSIHEITSGEVYIVYTPKGDSYTCDTIVISAESSLGEVDSKSVLVYNYANKYQYEGEKLLDKIRKDFYYNQRGLYAERIDADGTLLQPVSYLWPASHLLRAFKNGYKQNSDKYFKLLRSYSISLDAYLSDASGKLGYAAIPGDRQRFYDDNGLFVIQFSEIYTQIGDTRMLDRAKWAYDFCNNDRDINWGLPQHESELGQGMFYSMAVNQTGLGAALLYSITDEPIYLSEAESYYVQMNRPEILLKDPVYSLFHQYTFFQGGIWSLSGTLNGQPRNGAGFRAYQTTHVVQLAAQLFQITGERQYLDDAEFMLNKAIEHWYRVNGGLSEISFWGGDDMIDALIDMYFLTGEANYLEISKGIIDYLIVYGKDQLGYFPSDYDDNYGRWNIDRRSVEPESVLMMGQAAAASAMLRLAYAVDNDPPVGIRRPSFHANEGAGNLTFFPNIVDGGQELHLIHGGYSSGTVRFALYSMEGRIVQEDLSDFQSGSSIRLLNHPPGIYLITLENGPFKGSGKIIIN